MISNIEQKNYDNLSEHNNRGRGFTIIELMLAMTFLAFIMVFVMTVLIQLMNIYNKGLAMAQINQTGRQIYDDISDKSRFSSADSVIFDNVNRRLCMGGTSYLWNTDSDRSSGNIKNHYSDESNANAINITNLGIVRVSDAKANYCSDVSLMPNRSSSDVSLLAGRNVSVLNFSVENISQSDLLKINMVLSTSGNNKPSNKGDGWKCLDSVSNTPNPYCSFGEFNFLIYMRGGVL